MSAHQDQVRGFAKYNREFNERLFAVAAQLSDAERRQDMGAFFGSIHATLNHILLADRIWLGRFAAAFPELKSLHDAAVVTRFSSLREELCADFADLHKERIATDQVITAWTAELTDVQLAATMSYRNSRGGLRQHPAWIAVAHLFNHQTHHRGQVTTLLSQLGHDVGVTDYFAYVQ